MQEFSNQVREIGKEGLKDTVLWQRENLIWKKVEMVAAKMTNGITLRTHNK